MNPKSTVNLIFLLIFCALACAPRNEEFNPFDSEFRFHKTFDIKDYDTLIGECGYWNLTNRQTGAYYQFYLDEPEIVAKGFYVDVEIAEVDTTKIFSQEQVDSLSRTYPLNLLNLKESLAKLKFKDVRTMRVWGENLEMETGRMWEDSIEYIGVVDTNDSIHAIFDEPPFISGAKLIRRVGYFNSKPQ